jgi:hypothetical protein
VFPYMKTITRLVPSVASAAKERVLAAPAGTFLRRKDFAGTDRAVETALSRLFAKGELVRVRPGLYWVGKRTRFGMTAPSTLDVALAIAGPGAGPSGVSAARALGLTTQVPSIVEVAVPGKVPDPVSGVRFRSRSFARREHHLTPMEVAVIELLRYPDSSEDIWSDISHRIAALISGNVVRREAIDEVIRDERHRGARERWRMASS